MSKAVGAVLAVTGFLACPCHLVITLPLLVAVFGGTALGAFLAANTGLVAAAATAYFIAGLGAGWYLMTRERPATAKRSDPHASPICCPPVFSARPHGPAAGDRGRATDDAELLAVGR